MNNKQFSHIILLGRPGVEGVPETLLALYDYLCSLNVKISVETTTASLMNGVNVTVVSQTQLPTDSDLIIVVGGDGSLLNAAHIALPYNLPVLGINRGRLGFLTDIHPEELTKISAVLAGHYQQEKRFVLNASYTCQGKTSELAIALNDVVLLPGDQPQMIEFETYINGQFVCNQRADGLIVASPTGSTAYALSGGGPILHPQLDAIALVPMFPHNLSSRPLVIDADDKIDILVCDVNEISPYVSCDGHTRVQISAGSTIHVKKHKEILRLIHPEDYNYFATLREKLGWERRARRM